MPDLLDRVHQEISTRLAELRPLVDEHARLAAAMHALGDAPKRDAVGGELAAPAESSRAEDATGQGAASAETMPPASHRPSRAPIEVDGDAIALPTCTYENICSVRGVGVQRENP